MTTQDNTELATHPLFETVAALLRPLSDAQPAGPESKEDARYELVRTELQKLSGPASSSPDWNSVVREGQAFLTERSKDLSIACEVALAMWTTGGVEEGTRGLLLVAGLLLRFETLHPARPRARNGAVQTLVERLPIRMASSTPTREHVDTLNEAIRLLDEGVARRLGTEGPSTRPLREAAQKLAQRVPQPLPPPIVPAPATTPPPSLIAPPPAPALSAPPLIAPPTAAPLPDVSAMPFATRIQTLGDALMQTAQALRTTDALPRGYMRLFLTGLYLPLVDAPPLKLALPAPKPFLDAARGLHDRGDHAGCVQHILQGLGRARFALDAHRALFLSLEALGAAGAAAKDEVDAEVRALIHRHPSLLETQFRDGVPLANDETQRWLAPQQSAPNVAFAAAPLAMAEADDEALARASALAASGAVGEAMQCLESSASRAPTGLIRFRRRLALAALSASCGAPLVTESLYAELHAQACEAKLEIWEPELAAQAALGLVRALSNKADAHAKEQCARAFQALVRLAPSVAIQASK